MLLVPKYSIILILVGSAAAGHSPRLVPKPVIVSGYVPQQGDSLTRLIGGLRTLDGSFVRGGRHAHWDFTGSKQYLDAIADFGDSAVAKLAGCLADTTRAKATVAGRPVAFGVLCYEALTHTAYYEAYEERPEGPGKYKKWAGQIEPTATGTQLLRAKKAWAAVIKAKKYHLL